jgi:hypothetical protein
MMIENILAADFARLVKRFDKDAFTAKLLRRLRSADRMRLIAIGAAGGVGATVAAAQFQAVAGLIAEAAPMLAAANAGAGLGADAAMMATPTLLAALVFAIFGAATALVLPGGR